MKTIKPLNLCLLNRVVEEEKRLSLVSSVISFFSFQSPEKLLSETEMWQFVAIELGEETLFDSGMAKPRGEVLVTGSFYSPGGLSVQGGKVRTQLGNLNKELHVYGNRYWKNKGIDSWFITEPEPITELPISYKNSFGGEEYLKNPVGKGYIKDIETIEHGGIYPLPNIIDPRQQLTHPATQIEPAGFGPYDFIWEQRYSKAGTYDQQWLKESFPGFAADMDHTIFNTAPLDQQFSSYFNGNEEFTCENMHPDKPILQSYLPGISPRCFLKQDKNNEKLFKEVSLQLDTIWLFPHAEKGIIIHRGQTEILDGQAFDVTEMLIAYENLSDTPRPASHYQEALEKRLNPDKGHLYLLQDKDLIPPGEESCYKAFIEKALNSQEPSFLQKNSLLKLKNDMERSKHEFKELGIDLGDTFDTSLQEAENAQFPDIENLDILIEETLKKSADSQKEMEDSFREMTESMGLDYDQLLLEKQNKAGGRIEFSAEEIIEQLHHFGNCTPEQAERIRQTERHFDDLYRTYGHLGPAAQPPSSKKIRYLRDYVCKTYADGNSLSGVDLTGVDLSNLDLSGIDLQDSFMEGANLSQTTLNGANLSRCMMARTNLSNCRCDNAKMDGVNLGEADLSGARFNDCGMKSSVLAKALLQNCQFHRTNLAGTDLMECKGDDVDMRGADLNNSQFMEGSFKGADFSQCNLNETLFLKCDLQKADFQEANLSNAIFVESNADAARFSGGDLTNLRAVMDMSFQAADFSNTLLIDANLRGAELSGANFTEADLSRADLSECNLTKSRFYRAVAKQTMFMKANLNEAYLVSINLFEGSLQQASLINCDLRGANLFAADLLKADFSTAQIEQANLGKTLLSS